ncbi:MAG: ABC transporter ATP-binding protein [Myxococcales bacterium]|nr:ABC transporter ATP-binding protein [Myxococcales bacterium]
MSAPAPSQSASVVEFEQVYKIYGEGDTEVRALNGVDMRIDRGEFVAIMGSSGSGKSTAMNIIGCLDAPSHGAYLFRGVDVGSLDQDQRALLRRHYVGFVFQGYNLLARTTAIENVELPLVYRRVPVRERHERALAALDAVGLADRRDHTPAELSGGQQQRVAIARALVSEPSLLLADEPTGNLDSARKHETMELLVRLNKERGITIAMVTHEPDMSVYVSRVVMFKDGLIVDQGRPEDVEFFGPTSRRPLSQRGVS